MEQSRDEAAGLARDETAGRPLQLEAARSHSELVQRLFADAMLLQPYDLTVTNRRRGRSFVPK